METFLLARVIVFRVVGLNDSLVKILLENPPGKKR
jgi:hypothetical protein